MRGFGLVIVSAAWLLSACSGENATAGTGRQSDSVASREPRGEPMPHEDCVTGTDVQERDVNGDGTPDIRTAMEGGRPRCRETDANFDRRVDIYRWFDEGGQVTRVEDDYDFDGRIDVVASYEGGRIVRDVLDTNFDGRTDTWRTYTEGRLAELRRDSDGDGRVDTWERFDSEGRVTYAALDANRDGEPDEESGADGGTARSGVEGSAAPPSTTTTTTTAPATTAPATTAPATTPAPQAPANSGTTTNPQKVGRVIS